MDTRCSGRQRHAVRLLARRRLAVATSFRIPRCLHLRGRSLDHLSGRWTDQPPDGHRASIASETLALCGIPAQLEGNLIRVRTGVVGVSEACSGVRSLQTAIMIGLLFGD